MFPTPALNHSSHSSTSSISTIVLDLPFPRVPKHARFPCPYASPDEFAIEHQTYTSEEYDRTSIDPPTEEERACALPGRGERCLVANDDDEEECDDAENEAFEDEDEEEDDDAASEDGQGTVSTEGEGAVTSSRNLFRACRLDAGEESDREASPPPFPISSSSRKRARARPTSTPLSSRKASISSSAQESSPPSPTTQRRILWLQSQSDNLPAALKSRLLMLSSFGDSPPASPVYEDGAGSEGSSIFGSGFGSSPVERDSAVIGGGFPFSLSGLAAMRERMGLDVEDDDEQGEEVLREREMDSTERPPTFAESEPSSFTSSMTLTNCSPFAITPSSSEHLSTLSTSPSPTATTFFNHRAQHPSLSREVSTFSIVSTSSSTCTASSIASVEDGFRSPSCSSEVSTCYSSDQPHSHREDDDSESEHPHHALRLHRHHMPAISGLGFGGEGGGKALRRFDTLEVEEQEEEEESRGRSGFGLSRGFRTFEL